MTSEKMNSNQGSLKPEMEKERYFLDAVHFVHGAFLGHLWSFERLFVPSPSGRSRFNVLGALNAITKEVVSVENTEYINSQSVCEMLLKLHHRRIGVPARVVLDNARYQTCRCVTDFASALGIEFLFLPPYSHRLCDFSSYALDDPRGWRELEIPPLTMLTFNHENLQEWEQQPFEFICQESKGTLPEGVNA